MSLTDEGRRFIEQARPSLLGLQQALQTVKRSKEEFAGPLRIVGPRATFPALLWPLVEEFCRKYPLIVPDVQLDDRVGNWVEDRVDVGFRLGPSPQEGVIARRLFPVQLIICASPAYIRRYGSPATLADLPAHRCSVYRHPATGAIVPWRVKRGEVSLEQPVVPALYTNDEALELQAVLSGQVIGQLAGVTAARHIRSGALTPLLTAHIHDRSSYFVYFGSRSSQPARSRAFIDLAVKNLAGNSEYVLSAKDLNAGKKRPAARN